MMLELYLLDNEFRLVESKDGKELYYDYINNNYLVFTPYDDCSTDSIIHSMRSSAYLHLVEELNNNTNLVVEWSQVEGTTSDYDIYYNLTVPTEYGISYLTVKEYIDNIKISGAYGFKYRAIKNGIGYKIEV